jgi:hypothetical protein
MHYTAERMHSIAGRHALKFRAVLNYKTLFESRDIPFEIDDKNLKIVKNISISRFPVLSRSPHPWTLLKNCQSIRSPSF